ncbi:MAG TPA: hypothetical protein VFV23_13160 [Verrucomicrobiae bacterium]|nr:hypothetical protein [Verrucomicrobiae bacterium]
MNSTRQHGKKRASENTLAKDKRWNGFSPTNGKKALLVVFI